MISCNLTSREAGQPQHGCECSREFCTSALLGGDNKVECEIFTDWQTTTVVVAQIFSGTIPIQEELLDGHSLVIGAHCARIVDDCIRDVEHF